MKRQEEILEKGDSKKYFFLDKNKIQFKTRVAVERA
jgi:hypothetical protein